MADDTLLGEPNLIPDNIGMPKLYGGGNTPDFDTKGPPTPSSPPSDANSNDTLASRQPKTSQNNTNQTQVDAKELPNNLNKDQNVTNVIRDFDWTYSRNKNLRDDVPYVQIYEFKLSANSYMSSLISSALLLPDTLASNYRVAGAGVQNIKDTVSKGIKDSISDSSFGKFMGSLKKSTFDPAINGMGKMVEDIGKGLASNNTGNWPTDIQKNYDHLYMRISTGNSYIFPYFSTEYFSQDNNFSESFKDPTPFGQGLGAAAETVNKYASALSLGALTEPGMYVQRPKFYNFESTDKTVNVKFFLYNTINPDSYKQNIELLTRLIIQNTPRRFSRLLVDPPCIYELNVPGRCFYPYTFVSNLVINFMGTRRMIDDKIVPDAFEVNITFKSLTSEVNNFLVPNMGTGGIDVSKRAPAPIGSVVSTVSDVVNKVITKDSTTISDTSKSTEIIPGLNAAQIPKSPTIVRTGGLIEG